jgi:putative flippase GtrA
MYKIITEQIRALWDNGFFKQIIRFIITGALSAGLEFFVYTTLIAYSCRFLAVVGQAKAGEIAGEL